MTLSNLHPTAGTPQTDYQLVIIGNGMACFALLSELIQQPNRPQRILVIGDEALPAYNRVLLSPVLAGELAPEQAMLEPLGWYQQHGIDLHLQDPVVLIDRVDRRVISQQGFCWTYQQLVFACGAKGSTPEYARQAVGTASNICHFRNWRDLTLLQQTAARFQPHDAQFKTVAKIEDSHKSGQAGIGVIGDTHKPGHAIVVGGGFLGLEAAEGLRKQGMQVCLLQRSPYLLNRQLDATAADLLASELRGRGLMILTGREIASLQHKTDGNVSAVILKDGRRLPCDLLVLALGISPNIQLAQLAGVKTNSGICVDSRLQSSDPAIFALGECSEFAGQTFGLLAPIRSQATVLAQVLTGGTATFTPDNTATALKISGIDLWSCGDIPTLLKDPTSFDQTAVYQDHQLGDYRKLWWQQGRLVGAVLYGDTSNSLFYGQLLQQAPIEDSHQIQGSHPTLLFRQPTTVSPTTDPNLSHSAGELAA
ncbi:NAD(P)/FAD-dependent oxidoreductase [Rheinheimera riviphila]|uniref:NAD(P)/FAD-dependent oxidoreductase n=1 Tax=Rheinheimera riviphila TaxID=1834037 RepID=A0A437QSF1_9GAMM|nr:FAD-dependent oxidoreductase [Rheinheimera riviphila]RVU37446.1 NAD(P)/FAD-dependent oxidoreductase [Rheinheimera riviphila]